MLMSAPKQAPAERALRVKADCVTVDPVLSCRLTMVGPTTATFSPEQTAVDSRISVLMLRVGCVRTSDHRLMMMVYVGRETSVSLGCDDDWRRD